LCLYFGLFCGQIDALAFLPVDEVTDCMSHLKDTAPEEAETLLEYFDSTNVSGQLRPWHHHDGLRLNFRRTPPTLLHYQWNMHEVTMANQPQTNKICKGWNNRFHTLVGKNHPTICKLIETLQAECARISGILIQDEHGIRRKKSIPEFLHGISHNLRAVKPTSKYDC